MTRLFRVLMVLVFSSIALVGCSGDKTSPAPKTSTGLAQWEPKTDFPSSSNSKDDVDASSHSSSSSVSMADVPVDTGGYGFVAESISKTESMFWKCGAPTVKVTKLVYMTHNNGPEVSDMETDVSLALLEQGYHFYKRPCSRGGRVQDRIVQITIE